MLINFIKEKNQRIIYIFVSLFYKFKSSNILNQSFLFFYFSRGDHQSKQTTTLKTL